VVRRRGARKRASNGRHLAVHPILSWIESFFGHLKAEHPHLERIVDPGELEAELTRLHGHLKGP
jgi:hypothetical protein